MKVYLLFSNLDIVPEAIGVYASYQLAKDHMVSEYDEIIETLTDIDADYDLAWPEYKKGKQ